jgi:hypothetical protein
MEKNKKLCVEFGDLILDFPNLEPSWSTIQRLYKKTKTRDEGTKKIESGHE